MSEKTKTIARRYKDKLIEIGIPIDKVVVFGSMVKETQNKWSDLDICVVSPIFDVDRIAERVLLMKIGGMVDNTIEPHPMTLEDFNCRFNPLANEIRKYGVEV